MSDKLKLKLLLAIASVSFLVQFIARQPTDPAFLWVGLGAICFLVTITVLAVIEWIAKP